MLIRVSSLIMMVTAAVTISCRAGAQTTDVKSSTNSTDALSDLIKNSLSAVVLVEAHDASDKPIQSGSGFIVTPDGKVVTNFHVIKGAHSVLVKLSNGAFFRVEGLIASDESSDIAVLKVAGTNLPVLQFGDSDKTSVGQSVVAIGSPLGLQNSVSNGIISGLREYEGHKFLQTTAAASPGNSGGPLIDSSGAVLGIVTWKLIGGENLNFAVPANPIKALLAFSGSTVKPFDSRTSRDFKFAKGQAVYVACNDLQLQRRAEEQFAKDGRYKVATGLSAADFVFVAFLDQSTLPAEELAIVLLPDDYSQHRSDLDALRDRALWRGGGRLHGFGSEIQRLVKKFEEQLPATSP